MKKHLSSFEFSLLLALATIYISRVDASAANTITLAPAHSKFTSRDNITSVNLYGVDDIIVKNGTIVSSGANAAFSNHCSLIPTVTTYELLGKYQKEKTAWVTTVVVGDIIYALQYNFTIQAIKPSVYTDTASGKRKIHFADYGTYSTPLWKGFHHSNSMNVAMVYISHLTSLLLIVNDFVYFGSLGGNSLTFSRDFGPFRLEQQEFKKVFAHNKRLYVHVDSEKIHVYDMKSIKNPKFLGNIGSGVLKLKYANYTDVLPINNRYILISDYNFGIIKADDVDLTNITVKDKFTAIPNVTRIIEHNNNVAVVSDYEGSVSVAVVTGMLDGSALQSQSIYFDPTPIKQIDFDNSRLYLTMKTGVRAFYYKQPNETALNFDFKSPKSYLNIPKTAETLFVSINDLEKGKMGWLIVTSEMIYLLRAKDAVPELRCNMTAVFQGNKPSFFNSYSVNLELRSDDCRTNSSSGKGCTLAQSVVFRYYDSGVLGLAEENIVLVGGSSVGIMLAVVVAAIQLFKYLNAEVKDEEQGNQYNQDNEDNEDYEGKEKKRKIKRRSLPSRKNQRSRLKNHQKLAIL